MKYIKRAELVRENEGLTSQLTALRKEYATLQKAKEPKSKVKIVPDTKEVRRLENIIEQHDSAITAGSQAIMKSDSTITRLGNLNDILEKRIEIRDKTITGYRNGMTAYKELGFWAKIGMAFKSRLDVDMFFITKR